LEREGMASGATWLTTQKALDAEKKLAETINQGKGNGRTVLTSQAEFAQLLSRFESRKSKELGVDFKLSSEKVTAAKNTLMHRDQF